MITSILKEFNDPDEIEDFHLRKKERKDYFENKR